MSQKSLPQIYEKQHSILGKIRAFCFIFVLFAPLLFINALQALAFPLRWLAPIQNRRWNTLMAAIYWGYIAWMIEHVNKIDISLQGHLLEPKENSVLICNHQSAFDTLLVLVWAHRTRRVGTLRFLSKNVIRYIPGPGWGLYLLDCLFLKRNWQQDAERIEQTMLRYKKSPIPYCWIIYPEGTRSTPEKLALSQEKSRSKGSPVLHHVLFPRTRGFAACIQALGSSLDSVIDLTIVYPEGAPSVWQLMQGASPRVELFIERTARESLPMDQLDKWLEDRFVAKDHQIDLRLAHTTQK